MRVRASRNPGPDASITLYFEPRRSPGGGNNMRRFGAPATFAALLAFSATAFAAIHKETVTFRGKWEAHHSLFSGNESRLSQLAWVREDCTSKLDIRIVTPPAHGSMRFEEAKTISLVRRTAVQKKCYGKPVDAVSLYYKANDAFAGRDKIVLDIDTNTGGVICYTVLVDVEGGVDARQKAQIAPPALNDTRITRDVYSGKEERIAAMNYVYADCSSGPPPDLHVIAAPKNGNYRFETTTIPVDRRADSSRAACNGKPVNAVAVYYTANDAFTGGDSMVIDVDFRNGTVRRYDYAITVR
jgi:hypothetical protein